MMDTESTAHYTIMIYTVLHTLGEIIERNNLIINSNAYYNLPQGVDGTYINKIIFGLIDLN
jgi:hypothetical protein